MHTLICKSSWFRFSPVYMSWELLPGFVENLGEMPFWLSTLSWLTPAVLKAQLLQGYLWVWFIGEAYPFGTAAVYGLFCFKEARWDEWIEPDESLSWIFSVEFLLYLKTNKLFLIIVSLLSTVAQWWCTVFQNSCCEGSDVKQHKKGGWQTKLPIAWKLLER